MKIILLFLVFSITIVLRAQESMPDVKRQPQWFVPIYFEDANGDKDTIYIGYHSEADEYPAEDFLNYSPLDTTRFSVVWDIYWGYYMPLPDSVTSSVVSRYHGLRTDYFFALVGGKMPLTIKWDNAKLYSSGLPADEFPDNVPRPYARIDLYTGDEAMRSGGTVYSLANDTTWGSPYTDSIVIYSRYPDDSLPSKALECIAVSIAPYGSKPRSFASINDLPESLVKVYPNPFTDKITLEKMVDEELVYTVYDVFGKEVTKGILEENRDTIRLPSLPSGTYYFAASGKEARYMKMLIRL